MKKNTTQVFRSASAIVSLLALGLGSAFLFSGCNKKDDQAASQKVEQAASDAAKATKDAAKDAAAATKDAAKATEKAVKNAADSM